MTNLISGILQGSLPVPLFFIICTTAVVVAFAKCQRKNKEFAYITGFSSNVYKTISAAEARMFTTSTPHSYISAMLLPLKLLLFFCLDIF